MFIRTMGSLLFFLVVLYPGTNLHAAARSSTDAAAAYSSAATPSLRSALSSQRCLAPAAPASFFNYTYPHDIQRLIENPHLASFFDPLKRIIATEIFRLDRKLTKHEQSSLQKKILAQASSSARNHALIVASGISLSTIITHLIRHENNKWVTTETMHRLNTLPSSIKNHIAGFLASQMPPTRSSAPKDSLHERKEEAESKEEFVDQEESVAHLDLSNGVEQALPEATPAAALCAAAYSRLPGTSIQCENYDYFDFANVIYANDSCIVYEGPRLFSRFKQLRIQNYRTGAFYNIPCGNDMPSRFPCIPGTMNFTTANHFRNRFWCLQGDWLGVNSSNGNYVIVNLKTSIIRRIKQTRNPADAFNGLAFNAQGSHVAVVQKETIDVYETDTMKLVTTIKNTFGTIQRMILTNNNTLIISTSRTSAAQEDEYYSEIHVIAPGATEPLRLYSSFHRGLNWQCSELLFNEQSSLLVFLGYENSTMPAKLCLHSYDICTKKQIDIRSLESLGCSIRYDQSFYFSIAFLKDNLICYNYSQAVIWNRNTKKHITCDTIVYLNDSSNVIATQTADTITIFDEQLTPLRTIRLPTSMHALTQLMVDDTGTTLAICMPSCTYIVNLLNNTYYKYPFRNRGGLINQDNIVTFSEESSAASRACASKIRLKSIENTRFSLKDIIQLVNYDRLIQSGDIGKLAKSPSTSLPLWEHNIQEYYTSTQRLSPPQAAFFRLASIIYRWGKNHKEPIMVGLASMFAIKYRKILFGRPSKIGSMIFMDGKTGFPTIVHR